MNHAEQLSWERRWGRPAAAACLITIALVVAYQVLFLSVVFSGGPDTDAERLLAIDGEAGAFLASSVMQALSYVTLASVLWYLLQVTRYRRKELPGWSVYLVWLGAALLVIAGLLGTFDRLDIADQFASGGPTEGRAAERRADRLIDDQGAALPSALGLAGTLALAFSLVIVCLNALRAGVLSRFLGIIGIILGALYVLPFFGGPFIVQIFWLGALTAVFLGFWPGGRGPAWDSGEAQPWPSFAETRQRAVRERVERGMAAEPAAEPDSGDGADPGAGRRAGGGGPARRKRKRR
ncbi:MAG: DUF4386 family protein [Nocardioidaceae bacterium]